MNIILGLSIIVLFVMSLFSILLLKFATPQGRGARGESRVARILDRLNEEEYRVLNDVTVRTKKGTSQIDHVVISIYGIFVIETKNYSGWIHGREKSEYWTQTIYKKKTKFRNPIKQNWSHIYALKEVLSGYRKLPYYPIVVFAGSGELRNIYTDLPVLYSRNLVSYIWSKSSKPCLSIEQVLQIAKKLNDTVMHDRVTQSEHVHQVREYTHEIRRKERTHVCPKCGKNLVQRKGKYGKFYGCSGYPHCKYTKN